MPAAMRRAQARQAKTVDAGHMGGPQNRGRETNGEKSGGHILSSQRNVMDIVGVGHPGQSSPSGAFRANGHVRPKPGDLKKLDVAGGQGEGGRGQGCIGKGGGGSRGPSLRPATSP